MHLIILKWFARQKWRQKRKQLDKRCWSEKRNFQQKHFHLFKFVKDHANVRFSFLTSLQTCSHSSVLHIASFKLRLLRSSHKFVAIQILYLNIWIFKNHSWQIVFCNENLNNLENIFQRNLITDCARQCTFRVSGGTNFENLPAWHQPWCHFHVFDLCTGLAKETLDMSLRMSLQQQIFPPLVQFIYPILPFF